jgi:phage shock protein C
MRMAVKKNPDTKQEEIKRLYRSRQDKVIAGVCGGIGEYFSIDPVWVRIVMVLLIFAGGLGILLYLLLWILVPENPNQGITKKTEAEHLASNVVEKLEKKRKKDTGLLILGSVLIVLGVVFLFQSLFSWFSFHYVWPLLLIAVGFILLIRRDRHE